jgi:hypothetical protein
MREGVSGLGFYKLRKITAGSQDLIRQNIILLFFIGNGLMLTNRLASLGLLVGYSGKSLACREN